ncbi:hypothetical protein BT96DRAFT_1018810 [Gymnopus androsaceus JB14]|uniref:Uncharacterized protein n=1 Tax=Gymnopus androsaceus JB14 TaxID=1447944 RepID=A0A6A4HPM0_9AGAR|nr:hypothetical protein BT96DRAFT_1018810 [Gymnopus androsaceus JB14]
MPSSRTGDTKVLSQIWVSQWFAGQRGLPRASSRIELLSLFGAFAINLPEGNTFTFREYVEFETRMRKHSSVYIMVVGAKRELDEDEFAQRNANSFFHAPLTRSLVRDKIFTFLLYAYINALSNDLLTIADDSKASAETQRGQVKEAQALARKAAFSFTIITPVSKILSEEEQRGRDIWVEQRRMYGEEGLRLLKESKVTLAPTEGEAINLPKASVILKALFKFVVPQYCYPFLADLDFEMTVLLTKAAEKYVVYPAIYACQFRLRDFVKSNPQELLLLAPQHASIVEQLAPVLVDIPLSELIQVLPLHFYAPWSVYREKWVDALQTLMMNLLIPT